MTVFEHSFTLIGLVLGLALAHVLGETMRTVRVHGPRSLGLLTPLLAIFVTLDITTFWGIVWEMRQDLPSIWPVLGFGLVTSSLYYAAAVLVFPESRQQWPNLDDYYMRHRRYVLGLIFLSFTCITILWSIIEHRLVADGVAQSFFVVAILTMLVPWKWANALGLVGLICIDVWAFFQV